MTADQLQKLKDVITEIHQEVMEQGGDPYNVHDFLGDVSLGDDDELMFGDDELYID